MLKKIISNLLLLLISILGTFVLLEVGLRIYQFVQYRTPMFTFQASRVWQRAVLDPELGWKNSANVATEKILADAQGNQYTAKVSNGRDGFKLFGNSNDNNKPRVFIVGDSFTEANEVSNEKTYWAVLADNFKKMQFYVYGCLGYGNLQEFLIIDKYLDAINPQAILLQLCYNDFTNNDYILESNSYHNNNALRRPYLGSDGRIFYRNPKHLKIMPQYLLDNSRLFFQFNHQVQLLYFLTKGQHSVENQIAKVGDSHQDFRHAAQLTEIIMQKLKARAAGRKIYAFCVDDYQPYYNEYQQILLKSGITFIEGIPEAIKAAEAAGQVTRAADKAHWNELGHRIAGETIAAYFARQGFPQALEQASPNPRSR